MIRCESCGGEGRVAYLMAEGGADDEPCQLCGGSGLREPTDAEWEASWENTP